MSRPRRITTPLEELERPCGGCGHQNAVHTGGADKSGTAEFRWAIYDATWTNATGWCNHQGCDCQGRTAAGRRVTDDMPVRGDAA